MPVPRIFNETIVAANEAHTFSFPGRVYGYQFQARQNNVDILFAWQQGQIEAGIYMTLKAGDIYAHERGEGASIIEPHTILYFSCATAGTVVEFEVW